MVEYLERLPSRAPTEERYGRWLVRRDGALAEAHVFVDTDAGWAERLARDVEPWIRIDHPYASPVRAISTGPDRTVIVIGDERGPRIETAARALTDADERLAWTCDAVASVAELLATIPSREQPGVHGRVNRDELFVAADGRARLRAPIARLLHATQAPPTYIGQGRGLRGTVWDLAPEEVRGEPTSAATDVYALALTLHVSLTGSAPFLRDNPIESLQAILDGPAPPPLTVGHPGLAQLVTQALRRDAAERPALDDFAAGLRRHAPAVPGGLAAKLAALPLDEQEPRARSRSRAIAVTCDGTS